MSYPGSKLTFSLTHTLSCYTSKFTNDIIIGIKNEKPLANVRVSDNSNGIYKAYFLTFIYIDITFLSFYIQNQRRNNFMDIFGEKERKIEGGYNDHLF